MLNHPIFDQMKTRPAWTISSANKIPQNAVALLETGNAYNAKYQDERSFLTYDKLETIPGIDQIPNRAFKFDVSKDKLVLLDIEPKCPPELKQQLLKLPFRYLESSMSGKGIHMILDAPEWFLNDPIVNKKNRIQSPHGYFELILFHMITFTGKELPMQPGNAQNLDQLLQKLLENQKISDFEKVHVEHIPIENIPNADAILQAVNAIPFNKDLSDYDGHSQYEFAHLCQMASRLVDASKLAIFSHEYTTSELWALLCQLADDNIPYREKHDEVRNLNGSEVRFIHWRAHSALSYILGNKA